LSTSETLLVMMNECESLSRGQIGTEGRGHICVHPCLWRAALGISSDHPVYPANPTLSPVTLCETQIDGTTKIRTPGECWFMPVQCCSRTLTSGKKAARLKHTHDSCKFKIMSSSSGAFSPEPNMLQE